MKHEYVCTSCGAIVSVVAPREICPVCDAATLQPSDVLPPQDEPQWTQCDCRMCGHLFAIQLVHGVFACPVCRQTYRVVSLEPLYVVREREDVSMQEGDTD